MSANKLAGAARILASVSIAVAVSFFALLGDASVARSETRPSVMVSITADGQPWDYVSSRPTVGGLLKEAGVTLGQFDEVIPSLKTCPAQGMKIKVVRVEHSTVVVQQQIGFKTVSKFDPYGASPRKVIREGVRGKKDVTCLVVYRDGKESGRKVTGSRVVLKPVNEVVALSKSAFLASRAGSYVRSIQMVATGYAPHHCGGSASGRAAMGMHAGKGIVAVDPRYIPLGTKLYVEGYGFCMAGDTGGAIKGNRIDLGFDTYSEALRCGRRTVKVYVLGKD